MLWFKSDAAVTKCVMFQQRGQLNLFFVLMQLVLVLDSAFDIRVSKEFIPLFSLRLKFLT